MAKTALERLRDYRDKHYENDCDLADVLGITRPQFSQLINGVRRPGLATAAKIEARIGIPASAWAEPRKSRAKSASKSAPESLRVA